MIMENKLIIIIPIMIILSYIMLVRWNVNYEYYANIEKFNSVPLTQPYVYGIKNIIVQSPAQTPVVQEPVVQTPVIQTPVIQTPVVQTPVIQTPVVQTPVVQSPVIQTPVIQTPVIQTPVVQTPVVQTPVVQAPVVQAPVVQTPVVQTQVVNKSEFYDEKKPRDEENKGKKPLTFYDKKSLLVKTPVVQSPVLDDENKLRFDKLKKSMNNKNGGFKKNNRLNDILATLLHH